MDLIKAIAYATSGMRAQGGRIRTISENVANADSTGSTPGADPYRRKIPTFKQEMDRELGVETVALGRVYQDRSDFVTRYEPTHPAADEKGYVKYPNVNSLIEIMDVRAAQRSYEANLNVITSAKQMVSQTLRLLRS